MNQLFKLVKSERITYESPTQYVDVSRTTVSVERCFFAVCLRDNRVFLIYLALYGENIYYCSSSIYFFLKKKQIHYVIKFSFVFGLTDS